MRIEKLCKHCGGAYHVVPSKVNRSNFCSKECFDVYRTARVPLVCEQCGGHFEAKQGRASSARFCSRNCYQAWCGGNCGRTACSKCGSSTTTKWHRKRKTSLCGRCLKGVERRRRESEAAQRRAYMKEYARKNRQQMRETWKRCAAKRPGHYRQIALRSTWKRRASVANAPGSFSDRDIVRLWHRQRGECARCGCRLGARPSEREFEVDHITPLSRGGSNWPHNLQLLCTPEANACNRSKGNKTPAEYTLYLRRLAKAT